MLVLLPSCSDVNIYQCYSVLFKKIHIHKNFININFMRLASHQFQVIVSYC